MGEINALFDQGCGDSSGEGTAHTAAFENQGRVINVLESFRVHPSTLRRKAGAREGVGRNLWRKLPVFCSREYDVVIENEAESRSQRETDDIGGNIVGQRRIQTEDVVREQQAELRNSNAAHVREEE